MSGEIIEQGPNVTYVGLIIILRDYEYDPEIHGALMDEMISKPAIAFEGTDYVPPDVDEYL